MTLRSAAVPALAGALLLTLGLAFWQHLALRRLRAQQVGLAQEERASLRERIWQAEQRGATLEKELAEARRATRVEAGPADSAPGSSAERTTRANRGPGDAFNLANDPVLQRALNLQQRAALDARYAALFRALRLNPEQLERLKGLLLDKQNVPLDVMAAARSGGSAALQDRAAISKLMRESGAEVEVALRESLGETAYAEYQRFEQTLPQRQLVEQLGQRLSYSDTPLNEAQSEQLIRILAETAPRRTDENSFTQAVAFSLGGRAAAPMFLGGTAVTVTDEAVVRSQGILAPSQVAALRDIQAQQRAQVEAQEALRRNLRPTVPASGPGPSPAAPTTGGPRPPG